MRHPKEENSMSRRSHPSRSSLRPVTSLCLALLVICGAATLASADSHETPGEGDIKYRQKLMMAVGGNMGAIADIMKYGLDLPGHVENHASQMAEAASLVAPAFRKDLSEGSDGREAGDLAGLDAFREGHRRVRRGRSCVGDGGGGR